MKDAVWGMKVSPSSSYGALAEVFVNYTSEVIFVTGIHTIIYFKPLRKLEVEFNIDNFKKLHLRKKILTYKWCHILPNILSDILHEQVLVFHLKESKDSSSR